MEAELIVIIAKHHRRGIVRPNRLIEQRSGAKAQDAGAKQVCCVNIATF